MKWLSLVLLMTLIATGCAAQPTPTPVPPTAPPAADAPPTAVPAAEVPPTEAAAEPAAAVAVAGWQSLPLVNARTGETFTLADFAGKTVFVEPMATWCSNCRQQLGQVSAARQQLPADQVVFIGLSVEAALPNDVLADYANEAGFEWVFAVATPELLAELVTVFGRTVTNPPSTPHFIIRPDGTTTSLRTGIEAADEIVAQIRAEGGL